MLDNTFFHKSKCSFLICKNDEHSTILNANDAFYALVGYTKSELKEIFSNRFVMLVIDDLKKTLEDIETSVSATGILDCEYRICNKNGEIIWIHYIATYDSDKDIFYVTIIDITNKAHAIENLKVEASYDNLTSVLNRNAVETKIKKSIKQKNNKTSAMLLIDIDNFKKLNDSYGHPEGDYILSQVGEKFKEAFRKTDIIGRLGGDEFIAFISGFECRSDILKRVQKLVDLMVFEYPDMRVSASIGVTIFKNQKPTFKQIYIAADHALYIAKKNGKGRFWLEEL